MRFLRQRPAGVAYFLTWSSQRGGKGEACVSRTRWVRFLQRVSVNVGSIGRNCAHALAKRRRHLGFRLLLVGSAFVWGNGCQVGVAARSAAAPPAPDGPPSEPGEPLPEAPEPDAPLEVGAPAALRFGPVGDIPLVYVNQPEILLAGDYAEDGVAIYALERSGRFRVFFSHVNAAQMPIHYGIRMRAGGSGDSVVQVHHEACVPQLDGGLAYVQALNFVTAREAALGPTDTWFARCQDIPGARFFSGYLDATVPEGTRVEFVAFRGSLPTGALSFRGFVRRFNGQTDASRVYNGVAATSQVASHAAEWAFDDTTPDGPLRVVQRAFDTERLDFEAATRLRSQWMLHIGPGMERDAHTHDMLDLDVPELGVISVRRPLAELRPWANLANWGVFYRLGLRLENRGQKPRRIHVRMRVPPSGSASIAWSQVPATSWPASGAGVWRQARIAADDEVTLLTVDVPAHSTRFHSVDWLLAGPSVGALTQGVVIETPLSTR